MMNYVFHLHWNTVPIRHSSVDKLKMMLRFLDGAAGNLQLCFSLANVLFRVLFVFYKRQYNMLMKKKPWLLPTTNRFRNVYSKISDLTACFPTIAVYLYSTDFVYLKFYYRTYIMCRQLLANYYGPRACRWRLYYVSIARSDE